MFERFTERARQVVILAQEEARVARVNYIGTEHILLGILREEEGLAAKVLDTLGVNLEKAREGADARVQGREREKELEGQIPFTPRTKKVLETALREALSLGHNYIGTEHIVLGLIREGENVAVEILRDDFSLEPEQIRNEVIRMLSGPKAPVLKHRGATYENRTPEALERRADRSHENVERLLDMAITLGRQYPDVPTGRIVKAVLTLDN